MSININNIQNYEILFLLAYNVLKDMKGEFILMYNKLKLISTSKSQLFIKSTLIKKKISIPLRCLVWVMEL